jgi:5-methylcytosine-specific restriction endonuclease McrA
VTVPFRSQNVSPQACPALVLNADFRPLSYYPLSLWGWQDAIKAVFLDRVNIVSEYDKVVKSPSFEMRLPSVVSLKAYVRPTRHPAFTRFNVFLRDRFTCQYCGEHDELTFDHVIPRSKGGATTWENVVAACSPCNLRKSDRLPDEARRRKSLSRRRSPTSIATGGCFRPIICMRVGWIISIGIRCWSLDREFAAPNCRYVVRLHRRGERRRAVPAARRAVRSDRAGGRLRHGGVRSIRGAR